MKTYQYLAAASAAALVAVGAASAAAAPAPAGGYGAAAPAAADPAKTVGKVIFTANGKQHECTGNVVESANRDTVSTAGSCLYFRENKGDQGTYLSDVSFVPGYNKGQRPYGTWTVRAMAVTQSWQTPRTDGTDSNDVGFAVLNTLNGQHVQDVVGGTPVRFSWQGQSNLQIVGYAEGQTASTTCSASLQLDLFEHVPCGMGVGTQGAPWFVDGAQVNSTLEAGNGEAEGAGWHDEVKGTYDYAQSR
jgi:hypothetical protein